MSITNRIPAEIVVEAHRVWHEIGFIKDRPDQIPVLAAALYDRDLRAAKMCAAYRDSMKHYEVSFAKIASDNAARIIEYMILSIGPPPLPRDATRFSKMAPDPHPVIPEGAAGVLEHPMIARVTDDKVTLDECPIGLFFSADGELCLKTEYGSNEGRIDAYIVSSGEFFWGGAGSVKEQRSVMVTPAKHVDAAAAVEPPVRPLKFLDWIRWRPRGK